MKETYTFVPISERKPTAEGWYFWEGKGCGGYSYYTLEDGFEFDVNTPVNKVGEDYLCWLGLYTN